MLVHACECIKASATPHNCYLLDYGQSAGLGSRVTGAGSLVLSDVRTCQDGTPRKPQPHAEAEARACGGSRVRVTWEHCTHLRPSKSTRKKLATLPAAAVAEVSRYPIGDRCGWGQHSAGGRITGPGTRAMAEVKIQGWL